MDFPSTMLVTIFSTSSFFTGQPEILRSTVTKSSSGRAVSLVSIGMVAVDLFFTQAGSLKRFFSWFTPPKQAQEPKATSTLAFFRIFVSRSISSARVTLPSTKAMS